ncbi:MAG: hypothetical protein KIT27_10500 [Legionellales bacterium]|nr:hypothetical protein [Legionellales bacterium]
MNRYHKIGTALNVIVLAKCITVFLITLIFFNYSSFKFSISSIFKLKAENYKIWFSELASGIVTATYPLVFAFQLAIMDKQNNLIITYQLILQFTGLMCIPLMCSIQANLVEASACNGMVKGQAWWRNLIVTGLIPTELLLAITLIFNKSLMSLIYNYQIPPLHESYIALFTVATMIGQFGNALTTILRARKKSHQVTMIYYISDIGFLIGITQLIITLNIKSPFSVGVVTLIYAIAYIALISAYCKRSK